MRVLALAAPAVAVLLVSCSKPAPADAERAATSSDAPASGPADSKAPVPGAKAATPAIPAATLAYAYEAQVEAPGKRVSELLARHEAACAQAGPAVCEVTGSTLEARGRDDAHGALTLRGDPAWLARFRGRIGDDARSVGGRLIRATVTSEDLSRQVIDVEAAIRAKTALRDRLQGLLETRPGKIADFLEAAKDLADAQGDLDATQSQLAAMRQRLATSVLTIDYASAGVLAPEGAWAPLASAVAGASGIMAGTLAVMVTCFAALLPLALVGGAIGWLAMGPVGRRLRRRPVPPPAKP